MLSSIEDKLDRANYPLWLCMMHHVPVAKRVWTIVASIDMHHGFDAKYASNVADKLKIITTQLIVVETPTHMIREYGIKYMSKLMI